MTADDQMIDHVAIEQFAGLHNLAIARHILWAQRRIRTRMIVCDDHGSSILSHGVAE